MASTITRKSWAVLTVGAAVVLCTFFGPLRERGAATQDEEPKAAAFTRENFTKFAMDKKKLDALKMGIKVMMDRSKADPTDKLG